MNRNQWLSAAHVAGVNIKLKRGTSDNYNFIGDWKSKVLRFRNFKLHLPSATGKKSDKMLKYVYAMPNSHAKDTNKDSFHLETNIIARLTNQLSPDCKQTKVPRLGDLKWRLNWLLCEESSL